MLYELEQGRYAAVRPLFSALDDHLAVAAVIAGETPGRIYVDNPANPGAAVIFPWNAYRVYLAGAADNDAFNSGLRRLLGQKYAQDAGAASPREVAVFHTPGDGERALDAILEGNETRRGQWLFYRLLDAPRHDPKASGLDGVVIRRVDAALLEDTALGNRDLLVDEIHSESHSIDDFLRHKFGYCAQHGDALVGWCLSEYNQGDRCELGIETLEAYRRRGLAMLTASATIQHALARGIAGIGWHCRAGNEGSIAVATKLGFEKVADHPVRYCRYTDGASISRSQHK